MCVCVLREREQEGSGLEREQEVREDRMGRADNLQPRSLGKLVRRGYRGPSHCLGTLLTHTHTRMFQRVLLFLVLLNTHRNAQAQSESMLAAMEAQVATSMKLAGSVQVYEKQVAVLQEQLQMVSSAGEGARGRGRGVGAGGGRACKAEGVGEVGMGEGGWRGR